MNKKQFDNYKRILITAIALIFIVQKSFVYFEEKKEDNEIIFYSLPPQTETVREIDVDTESKETITSTVSEENKSDRININTASAEELQKLYRIGPALSARIIEYRESYGRFETIEEIKEVKGIGEKTFERIKDQICVN